MILKIDMGNKTHLEVFVKTINREYLGTSPHGSIDTYVSDDSSWLVKNWFKSVYNVATQTIGYASVYKKIGYTDTCKIVGLWPSSIMQNYNMHLIELKLEFDEIEEFRK